MFKVPSALLFANVFPCCPKQQYTAAHIPSSTGGDSSQHILYDNNVSTGRMKQFELVSK